MQRWREQYLGLAEFPPAVASADVNQKSPPLQKQTIAAMPTAPSKKPTSH